jgi:glucose/arabinose dehydrogenase
MPWRHGGCRVLIGAGDVCHNARMRMAVVLAAAMIAMPALAADELSSAGSPSPADTFDLDPTFVTGVSELTDFRWLPDGRIVLVAKNGAVWIRPAAGGAVVAAGSFAVDESSEKGLLGVAVDPQFATNARLYFYYSAAAGTSANKHRVVVRTLDAGGLLEAGETVLIDHLRGPANHDGGALDIGPDGRLYVGVGDTGCNSGAPPGTVTNYYGTCLADHPTNNGGGNGKILRIALDGSIPLDNPLVGATGVTACGSTCGSAIDPGVLGSPRTDVWAWGFRNPFRIWADPQTGRLWVGDVGEISYEEITVAVAGRHHGWPWREADRGFPVTKCHDVRVGTGPGGTAIFDQDCVDPVYRCRHDSVVDPGVDGGCTAITGGQIVDSCDWPPEFRGRYFFADSSQDTMWTVQPNATRDGIVGGRADFATLDGAPVAIHTANDGALDVATLSGRIARVVPKSPVVCSATTSTTTSSSTSTTSPVAPACAGLAGFERARCRIALARETPACPAGDIDDRTAQAVGARLARLATLIDQAAGATKPRRVRRLLARGDRTLDAIERLARRAARRAAMTPSCGEALQSLVDGLRGVLPPAP